jgi:hypothetical protein
MTCRWAQWLLVMAKMYTPFPLRSRPPQQDAEQQEAELPGPSVRQFTQR